jgi:monovalent cation:H+ antiporter-2, CPA2 family
MADLSSLFNFSAFDVSTRFLLDITLIMIIGGVSAVLFARLRMPAVIGYLAAGIIVGPAFPLHLVQDVDLINFMADLGIILLMFTIGLDFNLKKLKAIGLSAVLAGAIEVTMMIAIGYLLGLALGWGGIEALFLGAVMAGSSTAIIVKVLTETGRIKEEHATTLIGLLIVEDFASVFILALTSPIITGATLTMSSIVVTIITINAFVAISLILGMAVIPRTMDWVGQKYSSETLLLVSLGLCFSLSFISYLLGFSIAIGAFMMGIIISGSRSVHLVVAKTTPIEEMFLAVFFVSIGMLIDPVIIWNNLWVVALIAAVFIIGKFVAVSTGSYAANLEGKKAMTLGLSMVAMGEFAYVIAKMGSEAGVVSTSFYSTIIGASLITMLVLPVSIKRSDRTIWWVVRHLPRGVKGDLRHLEEVRTTVRQHLAVSVERRATVRREVIGILVDITFLFVVLLVANIVHGFELMLTYLESSGLGILPYIIFIQIIFALLLPATVNIIKRVRRIADVMAASAMESGHYSLRMGRLFYRMFMAIISILLFLFVLSFLAPLLNVLEKVPAGLLVLFTLIGGVLIYLLWNVFDSIHNKVCDELGRGIISDEPVEKPECKGPPGESGT